MNEAPIAVDEKGVPTHREILDACQRIQQKWSDAERRRRAGLPKAQYWLPPLIPIEQMGGELEREPELCR